jgi:hypothetical protein
MIREDHRVRTLDCVDCHNRATHIYEEPDRAIDERIRLGLMDRSLPYLKREALRAVSNDYPDRRTALKRIANHMHGFYERFYPEMAGRSDASIDSAIKVIQDVYNRNIHPGMNITWGAYPSHIGHRGDGGCFRCHSPQLVDEKGRGISYDCTLCHSMLSMGHDEPFQYLEPADTTAADYPMHMYLRDEFLNSFVK